MQRKQYAPLTSACWLSPSLHLFDLVNSKPLQQAIQSRLLLSCPKLLLLLWWRLLTLLQARWPLRTSATRVQQAKPRVIHPTGPAVPIYLLQTALAPCVRARAHLERAGLECSNICVHCCIPRITGATRHDVADKLACKILALCCGYSNSVSTCAAPIANGIELTPLGTPYACAAAMHCATVPVTAIHPDWQRHRELLVGCCSLAAGPCHQRNACR